MLDWNGLRKDEQQFQIMRALSDVSYFLHNPYFCPTPPLKMQELIMRNFYADPNIYELVLVGGRRGGKTTLGSFFSLYETFGLLALGDPSSYYGLAGGSEIEIVNLAKSGVQAKKTIFGKTKSQVLQSPYLCAHMNPKKDVMSEEIRFPDYGVIIESLSSSGASGRGRTVKLVMFDELAFFEETEGDQSGWSVYNAMVPSTSTFHDKGFRIAIGSVNHEKDVMMELYRRSLEVDEDGKTKSFPSMYGLIVPTWELNPENYPVGCKFLLEEEKKDPANYAREYACIPYQTEMQFFARPDRIEGSMNSHQTNVLEAIADGEAIKIPKKLYCLGMDPAARVDAFGFSLSHFSGNNKTIHDGLYRMRPERGQTEIDPDDLWDYIYKVWKTVKFYYAIIDVPMFPTMRKRLMQLGVKIEENIVKKEHWDKYKEAVYGGKVQAPYYVPWSRELRELILIRGKKVDHPRKGSKDVADAACNGHYMIHEIMPKPIHRPYMFGMERKNATSGMMGLGELSYGGS